MAKLITSIHQFPDTNDYPGLNYSRIEPILMEIGQYAHFTENYMLYLTQTREVLEVTVAFRNSSGKVVRGACGLYRGRLSEKIWHLDLFFIKHFNFSSTIKSTSRPPNDRTRS